MNEKIEVTENLIHIPIRESAEFIEESFRTITISEPRGISATIGRLKVDPGGGTKVQKYMFDKSQWTVEQAEAWIKDNKTIEGMDEKQFIRATVEKIEEDGILSVAVASDSGEDRDGEKILSEAWDFTDFMKNPVLLWAHDYRAEPIGKVLEIKKDGERTLFRPQFAVDISDQARRIYRMYKDGFLSAFSVGFMPKEREGNTFTKVSLLEISAVPVPSNPRALVLARSFASHEKGYETIVHDMEKAKVQDFIDIVKLHEEVSEHYKGKGKSAPTIESVMEAIEGAVICQMEAMKEMADPKIDAKQSPGETAKGEVGRGASQVDLEVAVLTALAGEDGIKRILQIIDKQIGLALRALNEKAK